MRAPDGASSSAIPRAELTRRREVSRDTSPSYGGSREIWDVLKAAVEAEDIHTARLFVESAGIIVVTPDMTCVFDERGAKVDLGDGSSRTRRPSSAAPGRPGAKKKRDRTPEDPNVEEPDRTREDLNPEADESPNDAERRTIEAAAEAASEGDERARCAPWTSELVERPIPTTRDEKPLFRDPVCADAVSGQYVSAAIRS